jgi:hypothetical protein
MLLVALLPQLFLPHFLVNGTRRRGGGQPQAASAYSKRDGQARAHESSGAVQGHEAEAGGAQQMANNVRRMAVVRVQMLLVAPPPHMFLPRFLVNGAGRAAADGAQQMANNMRRVAVVRVQMLLVAPPPRMFLSRFLVKGTRRRGSGQPRAASAFSGRDGQAQTRDSGGAAQGRGGMAARGRAQQMADDMRVAVVRVRMLLVALLPPGLWRWSCGRSVPRFVLEGAGRAEEASVWGSWGSCGWWLQNPGAQSRYTVPPYLRAVSAGILWPLGWGRGGVTARSVAAEIRRAALQSSRWMGGGWEPCQGE